MTLSFPGGRFAALVLLFSLGVAGCGSSGSSDAGFSRASSGGIYANGSSSGGTGLGGPSGEVPGGNGIPVPFPPGGTGTSGGGTSGTSGGGTSGTTGGGTSGGTSGGGTSSAVGFLYVTSPTRNGGGGEIGVLGIDINGLLEAIESVPNGGRPLTIGRSPDGRFVYAANSVGGSITSYLVEDDGSLTRNGPEVTDVLNARYPVFTPDQRFAYLSSPRSPFTGPEFINSLRAFTVGADGRLTQNGPPVPAGPGISRLIVNASGTLLYALETDADAIALYDIDQSSGLLSLRNRATTGDRPFDFAISSSGRYAYCVNYTNDGTISAFSVDPSTGDLTPLATLPGGPNPFNIETHPTLSVVYLINTDGLIAYAIDETSGALTQIGDTLVTVGGEPTFGPDRRFLYLFDGENNTIPVFSLAADGSVSPVKVYENSELDNILDSPRQGVSVANAKKLLEER